jgi:hypothetical protein
MYDSFDLTNL